MNQTATISNPWVPERPYTGRFARRRWGRFRFLQQPCSVVAVLKGKAITECVTINGAIRVLLQRGYRK